MSSQPGRSMQEWVHWFEIGAGARWIRVAGAVLGVLLLSGFVSYKLFRGPLTETTMAQAVAGRQLATGHGFTTLVNYPQSFAWAKATIEGGGFVNVTRPLPELHQAPLYSMVIAAALKICPVTGARADYVLLALNVALLWAAALQTFLLGRALFGAKAGVLAMLALLFSAPVWAAAAAVNGAALSMVLWLGLFQLVLKVERRLAAEAGMAHRLREASVLVFETVALGMVCGFLFLSDYALVVAPVVVFALMFRRVARGRRRNWSLVFAIAGFALVASPWLIRNVSLTGNPLALAGEGAVLKAGDPTAEPALRRATFSMDSPGADFKKIGNKALTSLQKGAGEKLWSGGGIFLTALFVAGLLYRFRDGGAGHLRRLAVGLLVAVAVAQAFFDSGEGERTVWLCMAPVVIVFGAGFFLILVGSSEALSGRAWLAALALLAAQAVPLARDVIAPRNPAYNYPPYLPALFEGMAEKLAAGGTESFAWMADVPAGAAWYGGGRVWARPATMNGFREVNRWQRVRALVLTPDTLARPFFGELAKPEANASAGGGAAAEDWAQVYRGLAAGRLPEWFPLKAPVRIAPDFYVLIDPGTGGG